VGGIGARTSVLPWRRSDGRLPFRRNTIVIVTKRLPDSMMLTGSGRARVIQVRIKAIAVCTGLRTKQAKVSFQTSTASKPRQGNRFTQL
jgi:hypothetical protein